jgi:hypothetical protein
MQILNFFITAMINIGIACVLGFFLLILLNGFSESQANPGLFLYVAWALLTALTAAALSVLTAKYLIGKKSFRPFSAIAISAPIFIIVGGIVSVAGMFAAVILIEALR